MLVDVGVCFMLYNVFLVFVDSVFQLHACFPYIHCGTVSAFYFIDDSCLVLGEPFVFQFTNLSTDCVRWLMAQLDIEMFKYFGSFF